MGWLVFILVGWLVGCTAERPAAVARPAPQAVAATPAPAALGTVGEFQPEVVSRRHGEMAWNGVSPAQPLFAFDAVQTRSGASARLDLVNGSSLSLGENALVILTPALVDRAVVRRGRFVGETRKELWVLTSAALFRLAPAKQGAQARAVVDLKEGNKLRVEVKAGRGVIEKEKAKSLPVAVGVPVEMPAPVVAENFGTQAPPEWEKELPPVDKIALAPTPEPTPRAPASVAPLGELVIRAPANYSQVDGAEVRVKGQVVSGKATVWINGNPVPVSPKGEFEGDVALQPGVNTVLIQALGVDGASRFRRWMVIRK